MPDINRDQQRARTAFAEVSAVADKEKDPFKKSYSTRCRKMPSIIHRSGLCQAIAFYQAKSKDKKDGTVFQKYLEGLARAVLTNPKANSPSDLARLSREAEFGEYHWLSRDAMQCAIWYKRYAEALIGAVDEEGDE
jgi:CRISPR-associated protein Cmr5